MCGRPLILYTIEAARASLLLEDLIISTDSNDIAEFGRNAGVSVPFMRPNFLASDWANKWDVFRHALEIFETISGKTVTYLVDMDVTVPLKTSEDIDGAIDIALQDPEADVVITAYTPERNPYFNMMELKEHGYAGIVKQSSKPIVRRQDAPVVFSLSPAAYVVKRAALYNFSHWSEAKCKVYPIPRIRAIDIDTEMDFKIVEFLMSQQQ